MVMPIERMDRVEEKPGKILDNFLLINLQNPNERAQFKFKDKSMKDNFRKTLLEQWDRIHALDRLSELIEEPD